MAELRAAQIELEAARERDTELAALRERERLARDLHADLDTLVVIARRHASAPDRAQRIRQEMFEHFNARLDAHGYAGSLARRHEFIDEDVNLNTQGLEVWLSRQ